VIRAGTWAEMGNISKLMEYSPSVSCKSIALVEKTIVKAMVIYDHWAYNSVQVHVWSSGPQALFNPLFVREMFAYPFEQCGRSITVAVTPADQVASLAVSKALGFVEIFRHKDGWKVGVDMVVKEMRKENCKWLQKEAA
jgi:hypothetical protein